MPIAEFAAIDTHETPRLDPPKVSAALVKRNTLKVYYLPKSKLIIIAFFP